MNLGRGHTEGECVKLQSIVQLQGQLAGQKSQQWARRKALHSSAVSCKVLGKGELVDCKNQGKIMEAQTVSESIQYSSSSRACPLTYLLFLSGDWKWEVC